MPWFVDVFWHGLLMFFGMFYGMVCLCMFYGMFF